MCRQVSRNSPTPRLAVLRGDAVARQIEAASIALDQQRAELAALHQAKSTP
ncbi:MAG: hypothetical protein IPG16_15170 [Comamonadaceae bacterium]|nr:hypothetical protein [Comamonadaceae bacterium]